MSGVDRDAADRAESMRRFLLTLFVATVMTAVTAYVLCLAIYAPERTASSRGALAVQHARS